MDSSVITWDMLGSYMRDAWGIVEEALKFMTSHTVFVVVFAASLVPVGFKLFKTAKRGVK